MSTCIKSWEYLANQTLQLKFTSDIEYEFYNVGMEVAMAFARSESKDRFFNSYIKGQYDYIKVKVLSENVVYLSDYKRNNSDYNQGITANQYDFEKTARENWKKMKQKESERLIKNKQTLRSYRIKGGAS